ncbi:TolC family protein [Rhodovastum atsumiense]|uniref:TolC family protein n=1 Tax=Rhodovastum atsumiense TaxID=504468 RepID=A0A5M6J105_9PROT|nr:TolC family protein [Rhodovastum atsumiense]KAA5614262.1 TolC family protein [Rhodovastum atsumiense]CAH2604715.1 TolC family protein [Rhodovastum atsumiense]
MPSLWRRNRGASRAPVLVALGLALTLAGTVFTPGHAAEPGLGATLESLIEAGHRLSPELRTAALESEAAAARADGAGALPDPMFSVGVLKSQGMTSFMLQQTIPLWGKLGLQKTVALQALEAVRGRERAARNELDERIKIAFARYVAVSGEIALNRAVIALSRQATDAVRTRYGQGEGDAAGVIMADTETIRAEASAARLEGDRRAVIARINALLARPADAPLAAPARARRLPVALPPLPDLVDRAIGANPAVGVADAGVREAQAQRELARRAWYPDVTVAAGPVQRYGNSPSFDATVSITLPFQTGPKLAGEREAAANASAARSRVETEIARIRGELGEQVAAFTAAKQIEDILGSRLVPRTGAARNAAAVRYAEGKGGLDGAILGDRRLREARIELLRAQMDGAIALAAIERLIGGEL